MPHSSLQENANHDNVVPLYPTPAILPVPEMSWTLDILHQDRHETLIRACIPNHLLDSIMLLLSHPEHVIEASADGLMLRRSG